MFVCYLAFAFAMQFSMEIMYHIHIDNLFLMNVFVIGQMILLGIFYYSILKLKSQKIFVKYGLVITLLILGFEFFIDSTQFF